MAPLVGSQVLTGVAVFVFCRPPARAALSWGGLLAEALGFVLMAAIVHAMAVWGVCRLLGERANVAAGVLIGGAWMAAAWLPGLALLIREHSMWAAGVSPLIALSATLLVKRLGALAGEDAMARPEGAELPGMFAVQERPSLLRTAVPAGLTSGALQVGVGTMASGHVVGAGLLFALFTVFPVWAFPKGARPRDAAWEMPFPRRVLLCQSLAALLLTMLALTPFLRQSRFSGGFRAMLMMGRTDAASPMVKVKAPPPKGAYSGVVLTLPEVARHITPPPVSESRDRSGNAEPVVIPFDGVYWYFKWPDRRPKADARVVRGDPTKVNIRSADLQPLSMEAHQHLATPVRMDCCSAIRICIQNADRRPGAFSIELLVGDRGVGGAGAQSLGTLVVPSSEDAPDQLLTRVPVDEFLRFPFPAGARGRTFDEISVRIVPSKGRALSGVRLAVKSFELSR